MTRHRSWHVPTWLERLGRASWLAIGIILLLAGVMAIFSLTRTILVPLILATLGAAVCLPLVDRLTRMRIPRGIAALVVLLVLLVAGAAIVILVISQIIGQADELKAYLTQGLQELKQSTLGPQLETMVNEATELLQNSWQEILSGIAPFVATSVSAIISLGFGIFIAVNILYYLLVDGRRAGTWLGEHIGLPPELGVQIVRHGVASLRGYFTGATIVAAFNGLVIGVTAVILGTPMAGVIALVNFLFSYIPYVGAIVGGAVAVILALASGDPMDGVYMLVVVILMNTVLQTVVMAVAMGATLKLHPLVVLLATTVGGIFAGAIGSALGAPIVAVAVDSLHRVRDSRLFSDEEEKADAGDSPADKPASPLEAAGDATSAAPPA